MDDSLHKMVVNEDGMPHSTHAKHRLRTVFNVALPARNLKIRKKLKNPGLLSLSCDAGHVWMVGWIHVVEHPYVVVTDAAGKFELTDVPPGTYTARVWHEGAGVKTAKLVVADEVGAKLEIAY